MPGRDERAAMNLKEGTRRLALLLGAVGAILGGFVSYFDLQSVMDQRSRHNRFEKLANSDVVKQEQKSWSLTLVYTPDKAIESFRRLPENQQRDVYGRLTQKEQVDLLAKLNCEPVQPGAPSTDETRKNLLTDPKSPGWEVLPGLEKDDPYACTAEPIDLPTSTVNKGGIKAVRWSKTLAVDSIETEDGSLLLPTPAPSVWEYLLVALFPLLGFFVPWGAVRAIGWVVGGFVKSTT
jgi:hypothetical protein